MKLKLKDVKEYGGCKGQGEMVLRERPKAEGLGQTAASVP